jgi:geranylgeranyl diphosphate synthase type II
MDDDDFRRGKPTNHRVFGEAVAVLSGDALCIHAFELLSKTNNCRIVADISRALGTAGMIGGQVADIESEGKKADKKILEYIHTHKTAALITTSLRCGAILAGTDEKNLKRITLFGRKIGLAFQIADDILDVVGTTAQLGKDAHSDEALKKVTYPSILGLEKSRQAACDLTRTAKSLLKPFGKKAFLLCEIADFIIERIN